MQDLLSELPEYETYFEEYEKCSCDNCVLENEIKQLRSSLIWILAQNPKNPKKIRLL